MISTAVGDILDTRKGTILHQVNCKGITGGLAGALRRKWPEAFEGYLETCDIANPILQLGYALRCRATEDITVCHIFGQVDAGAGTDLKMVEGALRMAKRLSLLQPIYAPSRMGCGIGGGNWSLYLNLLKTYFPDLILVALPISSAQPVADTRR